jgi:hypothetical protein
MTQTAQGALTLMGLNTPTAQVFWNGIAIPNITSIRTDWELDEQRVKLKVSMDDPIHDALRAAGISVKKERDHE